MMPSKLGRRIAVDKNEILEISRRENKNKDLVELEIASFAGNIAGRVGACVCCLISLICYWVTDSIVFSPWIIYFSILGTHYLVKFIKVKEKTDLMITMLYYAMCIFAFLVFVLRLVEIGR